MSSNYKIKWSYILNVKQKLIDGIIQDRGHLNPTLDFQKFFDDNDEDGVNKTE